MFLAIHVALGGLTSASFGCPNDVGQPLGGKERGTYLCGPFQQRLKTRGTLNGGIAQLARALAWHARGPGFESPYLHQQPATGIVLAP